MRKLWKRLVNWYWRRRLGKSWRMDPWGLCRRPSRIVYDLSGNDNHGVIVGDVEWTPNGLDFNSGE